MMQSAAMHGVVERVAYFYEQGGPLMPVLVLEALLLWYALGYRMVALSRGSGKPVRVLMSELSTPAARPRAIRAGIVTSAIVTGHEIARTVHTDLRSHLDVAFDPREQDLRRFATLADAVVVIAPLTGLLGTVSGMIETFDSLADMALFSQSGGIAGGIAEALFTTQMGLAVAIPGLLVGRLLRRKQEALASELAQIKDALCMGIGVSP